MDYPPQIEKLLDKYWAAETSVIEERELLNYFVLHPEHSDANTAYFLMIKEDQEIESSIPPRAITANVVRPLWKLFASVAAAIVFVAIAGFLIQNQLSENKAMNQSAEVISDKEADEAYAQAREALLLVSRKLNASKNKVAEKVTIIEPYTRILK